MGLFKLMETQLEDTPKNKKEAPRKKLRAKLGRQTEEISNSSDVVSDVSNRVEEPPLPHMQHKQNSDDYPQRYQGEQRQSNMSVISPDQVSKLEQLVSDFSEEGKYNNEDEEDPQ